MMSEDQMRGLSDFARIVLQAVRQTDLEIHGSVVVRIFMEGQEEWLEPGGEAMVVLAKMLAVGALIALLWGAFIRFTAYQATGKVVWPSGQFIVAMVFSFLSLAFYLGGKLGMFAGRKMRERGIKLP